MNRILRDRNPLAISIRFATSRKSKLLDEIKAGKQKQKETTISEQVTRHVNKPARKLSWFERYLLPKAFPEVFGSSIPNTRKESIDRYLAFYPNRLGEDLKGSRDKAKADMLSGMIQTGFSVLLPYEYIMYIVMFSVVGFTFYMWQSADNEIEAKQEIQREFRQQQSIQSNQTNDSLSEENFKKQFKIQTENILRMKFIDKPYTDIHISLQKLNMVTGEPIERQNVESFVVPEQTTSPFWSYLSWADHYDESILSEVISSKLFYRIKNAEMSSEAAYDLFMTLQAHISKEELEDANNSERQLFLFTVFSAFLFFILFKNRK